MSKPTTKTKTRPTPHVPQPNDIYEVVRPFTTAGSLSYAVGDRLLLLSQTDEVPHGFESKICNWRVRCKHHDSVWSAVWYMVEEGWVQYVGQDPNFSKPCCGRMEDYSRGCGQPAEQHAGVDGWGCADRMIVRVNGNPALPLRDGGRSGILIAFCPWCGRKIESLPQDDETLRYLDMSEETPLS